MAKESRYELNDEQLEEVVGGLILVVERIEGNYVITVDENGHSVPLNKKLLPQNIREGDVISKIDNKYRILDDMQEKMEIEKLQTELFNA